MDSAAILIKLTEVLKQLQAEPAHNIPIPGGIEIRSFRSDDCWAEIHTIEGKVVFFSLHDTAHREMMSENSARLADMYDKAG